MNTLVIYDSAFGNTQQIAEAIGQGLNTTDVRHIEAIDPAELHTFNCVVVGSPTQRLNFTEDMGIFLGRIPQDALKDVKIAAFDTRISIDDVESPVSRFAARVFLHRYAAGPIANHLKKKGGVEVSEPAGFYVMDTEGPLKEGELERARAWAQAIVDSVARNG